MIRITDKGMFIEFRGPKSQEYANMIFQLWRTWERKWTAKQLQEVYDLLNSEQPFEIAVPIEKDEPGFDSIPEGYSYIVPIEGA